VLAQRLVRTLCPECKAPDDTLDTARWEALTLPWRGREPQQAHRAVGCPACRQSGYKGRVGLYELLTLNDGLRQVVGEGPDSERLRRAAMQCGWRPLRLSGALKVSGGITTVEEVLRNAPL
jgi:general secretion pathway protein E